MDALAAAGLLLDLYEQKRLRFNKQHVAVDGKLPTTHPQLEAAAHVLSGPTNGLPIAAAIDLMVARLHPLAIHLLESLFRRDVLHRVRSSWWPFSPYRFPLRSLQARNEAIQQLSVAVKAETPSVRGWVCWSWWISPDNSLRAWPVCNTRPQQTRSCIWAGHDPV